MQLNGHHYREAETESAEALAEMQPLAKPDPGELVAAYLTHSYAICGEGRCGDALSDVDRAMFVAQARLRPDSVEMVAVWLARGFDQWKNGAPEDAARAMGAALQLLRSRTDLPQPLIVGMELGVMRQYDAFLKGTHRKPEEKQLAAEMTKLEVQQPVGVQRLHWRARRRWRLDCCCRSRWKYSEQAIADEVSLPAIPPSGRQRSIHLFRPCRSGSVSALVVVSGGDLGDSGAERPLHIDGVERGGVSDAVFLIVLTHEFGHAMACRSVGGTANFQDSAVAVWRRGVCESGPHQRPGATLWSIAAGPLVNVALAPLFYVVTLVVGTGNPDLYEFVHSILWIDMVGLLIFNMLPIYPLDGGQILRSLLWFPLGPCACSLMVATVLGFVGIVGLIAYAVLVSQSIWTVAICVFLLLNCWNGLQSARKLLKIAKLPRRDGFKCPSCRTAPPIGTYWKCGNCQQMFDTFETGGVCAHCGAQYATTTMPGSAGSSGPSASGR